MRNKMIKIEIVVIILLITLIVISLVFKINKKEEKEKIQVAPGVYLEEGEENILDSQTIDGMKLEVTRYMYDPNIGGELTVRITNTNKDKKIIKGLKVKLISEDKKYLTSLQSQFYAELEKNESYEFIYNIKESITQNFIPEYTIIY